jgi:lipoate-protein ligase B
MNMIVRDLGVIAYRDAWNIQEQAHQSVLEGGDEQLLLLEHSPVITFGRRAETQGRKNLVATEQALARLGVELVQSDRGGDITFHGPGQLVAYPIVRLSAHRLSVGAYVRTLLEAVRSTLHQCRIESQVDRDAIGVWTRSPDSPELAKICALGVRIRRGVSLHGVALNVTTDLSYFNLIVPCGLAGRAVTSVQNLLGANTPPMPEMKQLLAAEIQNALA